MVKESLYYKFLRYTLPITLRIFYRRIQVTGYDNIPKDTPILFTSNHQNALMDALIICIMSGRKAFFLARADIFKKKAIADIMYKLRILPVYRTRDGVDSLSNNNDTFDKSVALLEENQAIVIFVEGNHNRERRLRDLKKGYARIAFAAAEKVKQGQQLEIVPVGINYNGHLFIQTDVVVNYGKPIKISDYLQLYKEKPAAAMHRLTEFLAPEIKKLMLSIDDKENIRQIEIIKDVFINEAKACGKISNYDYLIQLQTEKELIKRLDAIKSGTPEVYANLIGDASRYLLLLDKYKLKDELLTINSISKRIISDFTILLMLFPLLFVGYIFNIIPYQILKTFLKKIKDDHFHATFSFGIGMFLFPLFYIILIISSLIFCRSILVICATAGIILLSSYCILKLRRKYFALKSLLSFKRFKKMHNQEFITLVELRKNILL
jgi:1-acyl-sn-glycerol-3-phosphate acyltransferase